MCQSVAEGGRRCKPHASETTRRVTRRQRQKARKHLTPIIDQLREADGGFTYRAGTSSPTTGYCVSPFPERSRAIHGIEDLTDEQVLSAISAYRRDNTPPLNKDHHYLGAWNDPETGIVFLDVSVVTQDAAEAEQLCRDYDQIAYFSLTAGESITVNQNATSGGVNNANTYSN